MSTDANRPTSPDTLRGPVTMPTSGSGWWETERATMIRDRIDVLSPGRGAIVDVGCGRGEMLTDQRLDGRTLVRVDAHIWQEWKSTPGLYVCAHADALPFRSGAFDLVGSFDVLEHIPDDMTALREQCRITTPGGVVVTAVPADQRLWSSHDEAVGHERRYDRRGITKLAACVGLVPERASYFFSYLWLPARLLRSRPARRNEPGSGGDGLAARATRGAIHLLSSLERAIMRRFSIPFGTSLWIEFKAPEGPARSVPRDHPVSPES